MGVVLQAVTSSSRPQTSPLEQAHYFRGEYERAVELAIENLAALPPDWVYEYFGFTKNAETEMQEPGFSGKPYRQPRDVHGAPLDNE